MSEIESFTVIENLNSLTECLMNCENPVKSLALEKN